MSKFNNKLIVTTSSALTPVQGLISKPTIQDFAEQINQACQQTIDGIFKIAELCSEAMEAWPGSQTTLVSLLKHMDEATFSRYRMIGDDKRLPAIKDDLPPHYSTIYELTKLKGDTLYEAHAAGEITPKLLRKQANKLVETFCPETRRNRQKRMLVASMGSSSSIPSVTAPSIAPSNGPISFTVDWDYEKHDSREFRDWLDEGRKKFGVKVLNRLDDPDLFSSFTDRSGEDDSSD